MSPDLRVAGSKKPANGERRSCACAAAPSAGLGNFGFPAKQRGLCSLLDRNIKGNIGRRRGFIDPTAATYEDPGGKNVCPSSDGRHPSVLAAMSGHSRPRWGGINLLKRLKISERHCWERRNNAQVYFQPPY